eukprot:TRINITY_DN1743_c0_g1_i1.p1 TRINITY_DN1743_c0_g1~~TRINITY_DN1743_c0_g1_i1.p1  ORF type:complete len:534 (+),score=75.51 TRINITY_DN1743_c0_g1_i1:96-1697(+)
MEVLHEVRSLVEEGQYSSAAQLCGLGLGYVEGQEACELLTEFGDALVGQRQFKRALLWYTHALDKYKGKASPLLDRKTTNFHKTATTSKHKSPSVPVSLYEKLANCCMEVRGDPMENDALEYFKCIDEHNRTLKTHMAMATLYRGRGNVRSSSDHYLRAIQKNQYCLDAVNGYIETSRIAMANEGQARMWDATVKKICDSYEAAAQSGSKLARQVHQWIVMQYCKHSAKPAEAIAVAKGIRSPLNTYITSSVAECYYRLAKPIEALSLFNKVRSIDPYFTGGMDIFSTLLRHLGQIAELNKLASECLDAAPSSPETWIVASVAKSGNSEQSADTVISYALKAIPLSPCFHRSYLFIASHLVSAGRTQEAIKYYMKALNINRYIPSYQGIVRAYVRDKNGKAALAYAKEATDIFPSSAPAWALLGQVYHCLLKVKLARDHFTKALGIDSQCVDALLPLCDLDCEEGKHSKAINRLNSEIPSEQLLLKKAAIYSALSQQHNAESAFQHALQLNPNSQRAKEGLRKLQGLGSQEDD